MNYEINLLDHVGVVAKGSEYGGRRHTKGTTIPLRAQGQKLGHHWNLNKKLPYFVHRSSLDALILCWQ